MLTRAWSKAMRNKKETDQAVLQYILTWKPWTGFITFYGKRNMNITFVYKITTI
jgi:3-methyladenine DNA glycosylase/8-oxoguanine DNA glycosylase